MNDTLLAAPSLPFELCNHHVYVRARLNGRLPVDLLIDTGAGVSIVDADAAREAGLGFGVPVEVRGAGEGSVTGAVVQDAGFDLEIEDGDGSAERQPATFAMPLAGFRPREGRAIGGILGADWLSRYALEIDYSARRLRLHDPEGFHYDGPGEVLPLTFRHGHPHTQVKLEIEPGEIVQADAVIDLGAATALVLTRPFAASLGLPRAGRPVVRFPPQEIGAGGSGQIWWTRAEALHLGSLAVRRPVAGFSRDRGGALGTSDYFEVNVGGEILARCRVIFDYRRQQLVLEPAAGWDDPYELDMSGLDLTLTPGGFRVQCLSEEGLAAAAGVGAGDLLATVDGRPATDFDLDRIRRYLRTEGVEVRLGFVRDGKAFERTLRLRRAV